MIAINNADITINIALNLKNPKSKTVIGKFAQGDAKRNAITAEVLAPLRYNSIAIARIP